jgi:hypothetical protein
VNQKWPKNFKVAKKNFANLAGAGFNAHGPSAQKFVVPLF